MANICLPEVAIKEQLTGGEYFLIETEKEIKRFSTEGFSAGGGNIEVDTTLTKEGMAADAAAAGDRISTVEDLISDGLAYVGDGVNDATTPINADTLGGKDLSYFAQKSDIKPKAGFIYPLATPNVPDGFLLCDGKAYSRTEYVELFAAIGTYYGEGDGSTTFNVPNLQTRVPVGAGNGYELGSVGGEATHALTVDEMPSHKHIYTLAQGSLSGGSGHADWSQGAHQKWTTDATGGGQAHNNMQPYTVINYIISTGKESVVYIRDVITGAQVMPLEVQYGGTGATNADDARKNLGVREHKRNLLDNSDFRNPVNQRGATSCTGAWSYFIDRWVAENATVTIGDAGVAITDGYLTQRVPKERINANSSYTLAACDEGGIIYVGNNAGDVLGIEDTSYDFVTVKLKSGRTYRWAALYEGEYTAETLPPYVSKGYGAELMECQRYYQKVTGGLGAGVSTTSGSVLVFVPLPVSMRLAEPTVTFINSLWAYTHTGNAYSLTYKSCLANQNGIRLDCTSNGSTNYPVNVPDINITLSADL